MLGLLHGGTLEACSSAQLQFISNHLPSTTNQTAQELFAYDVEYFPIVYGIWALVYGVLFGAIFSAIYARLPGSNSKRKGIVLGFGLAIVSLFVGPGSLSYSCGSNIFPILASTAGVAAGLFFGLVLGIFYDSFGRLHEEEEKDSHAGASISGTDFGP